MIRRRITARVNADDELRLTPTFIFDEEDPYFIELVFDAKYGPDDEEVVWVIGRNEMYEAVYQNWPSGTGDIIMIRFKDTLRVYLKNEHDEKMSLDFPWGMVKDFLDKTYRMVTHYDEQQMLINEIGDSDKWI